MQEAHQEVAHGKGDAMGGEPLAFVMSVEPACPGNDRSKMRTMAGSATKPRPIDAK